MIVAYFIAKRKGYDQHAYIKQTIKEKALITWQAIPSLGLIIVVIGGIIGGVFTATEGACIAVLYSFILSLCYRSISWADMKKSVLKLLKSPASCYLLSGLQPSCLGPWRLQAYLT